MEDRSGEMSPPDRAPPYFFIIPLHSILPSLLIQSILSPIFTPAPMTAISLPVASFPMVQPLSSAFEQVISAATAKVETTNITATANTRAIRNLRHIGGPLLIEHVR